VTRGTGQGTQVDGRPEPGCHSVECTEDVHGVIDGGDDPLPTGVWDAFGAGSLWWPSISSPTRGVLMFREDDNAPRDAGLPV
jgi:hypothetical protein